MSLFKLTICLTTLVVSGSAIAWEPKVGDTVTYKITNTLGKSVLHGTAKDEIIKIDDTADELTERVTKVIDGKSSVHTAVLKLSPIQSLGAELAHDVTYCESLTCQDYTQIPGWGRSWTECDEVGAIGKSRLMATPAGKMDTCEFNSSPDTYWIADLPFGEARSIFVDQTSGAVQEELLQSYTYGH